MAKKYFGYVAASNSIISSAGVCEFNDEDIRDRDKDMYHEHIKGNKQIGRKIISVYPNKIYFIINNIDLDQPKFATKQIERREWAISLDSVQNNLADSWKQIYKNKSLIFKEIFDQPIH